MYFDPEPNKQAVEVLFSTKEKYLIHPPVFFNGIEVTRVDEHKHLGLILDPKLTFISQCFFRRSQIAFSRIFFRSS